MDNEKRITVFNIFRVKPENQERLVQMVADGMKSTASKNEGFVTATVYKGIEGTLVMSESTWRGDASLLGRNHEKNMANLAYVAAMKAVAELATTEPHPYVVAATIGGR